MKIKEKKPSNPRMTNPDGVYASEAILEDFFSLRDHFAGLAMQGIDPYEWVCIEELAKKSYAIADAMLKQREL